MVTNQKAQKEVERLKANISFLPNLSITLRFLGGLVIIIGIFCTFVSFADLGSYNEAKKLAATSMLYSGIAGVFSGIFLLFFSAIGEAINDIRIHTIADFNLRHEDIEATNMEENSSEQTTYDMSELEPITKNQSRNIEENATNISGEDFKIGDIVELKSNQVQYKIVGFDGDKFVQCEPVKKGIFDNFKAFKRNEIRKV